MNIIVNNINEILKELNVNISEKLIELTIKTCIRQIIERLNKNINKDEIIEVYEDVITELVLEEVVNLNTKLSNNGAISVTQGARSITFADIKTIDYTEKIKALVPTYVRLF